jgi:hypothetical protein
MTHKMGGKNSIGRLLRMLIRTELILLRRQGKKIQKMHMCGILLDMNRRSTHVLQGHTFRATVRRDERTG